jgi:type VI secretion system protein VasJ
MLEDLTQKAAPFLLPICAEQPCGKDPSYEPDFESVKAEIDKLTALSGEPPDFRRVITLGEQLLQKTAKDLRLAVWMSVARQRTNGLAGLVEGLVVTRGLASTFWDGMFPDAKRARARANLFGWLSEQATQYLLGYTPGAADRGALEALEVTYKDLDGALAEKLGDLYPGMGSLRSALRDKLRQLPAEPVKPPPAPVETAVPTPAAVAAPPPAAPSAALAAPESRNLGSADDVLPALRSVGETIVQAAGILRQADPAQAFAYRLQRTGVWLTVTELPSTEGRATRIPPPDEEDRRTLEAQLSGQRWLELLNSAEDLTNTYIYWFDLQRFVATAMDRLGAAFLTAREAMGRELLAFLDRFPTLTTLTFSDGTPFCDPATEAWLEEERAKWGGGGRQGGGSAKVDEEEAELARRFEEAKELVVSGKVGDGLSLAIQLASRGADARSRFRARVAVANLAMVGGKPDLARPILEGLVAEAERHHLEDWEPALCASVLAALLACKKATTKPDEDPGFYAVYDRLCRLDPGAALRIIG